MLRTVAVANYRSLRSLLLPLGRLTVITGANGSGKSSLYRALRLLADTAQGRLVGSLAREGGLPSTLWAGPEVIGRGVKQGRHAVEGTVRQATTRLKLGFAGDDFGYAVELGLPQARKTAFMLDSEIKRECIWSGAAYRPSALLADRRGPAMRVLGDTGRWDAVPHVLASTDSMMTAFADPRGAPEMITVREGMRAWRFYDHFRTDPDAPARHGRIGTHTAVLADDGADLAASLQTIREIGDGDALDRTVADAFPGASVAVTALDGRFELTMRQHGLLRPLGAAELSDGTLRYLLLAAALLTPRPPSLMVLNEPETSLHPDLVPALARLVVSTAARAQILVVTHSAALIEGLAELPDSAVVTLEKQFGETSVAGQGLTDRPRWTWPEP